MGRSYNTDDIDEADLEAELAAMEELMHILVITKLGVGLRARKLQRRAGAAERT